MGARRFTVSLHTSAPVVMLVGIDCHAADGGEVHDSTLVSRWTSPSLATFDRLDALLAGMAQVAAELESARPAGVEAE